MIPGSVERIAHYRVLKRVGRGGMGIVYRAVDERDGRLVALKVIRGSEGPGEDGAAHVMEARVRFDREAEILRGLLHVNVVSFYEIGEDDGTPYLAMEFLEGVPLGSFAGRPYPETLPLLIQAAHGLEYLASRGIVHRDLSPDNIFVVAGGDAGRGEAGAPDSASSGERIVKLLDFGVAKLFEAATGLESLTATGFFLGKVAYGSPEQLGYLGHGAPLDFRSDVYSLGLIFHEVLSGQRPFQGSAPVEYIAAHLSTTAPPAAAPSGAPGLPIGLVRLVSRMLEKRREDRPAWREIIDGLVAVLRDAGSAPAGGAPRPALAGPREVTHPTELVVSKEVPPHAPRARAPLARTALAVVLLAAALGFLMVRGSGDRRPPAAPGRETSRTAPRESRQGAAPLRASSAAPATGSLRLFATPFARVVSVTEAATGRALPLAADASTPALLERIAPGRYRVLFSCPALDGKTAEREVTVLPGETSSVVEPFLSGSELAERIR